MNEVMCLAYDKGCKIYYQDTDSMHIKVDHVPILEAAFEEKYGRKLIGSDMGQFHSDFEPVSKSGEIPYTTRSIFLMKKMYLDVLTDSSGATGFHVRGKGLTQNSIKAHGNLVQLYEDLYNGSEKLFDLTVGQPCFKMNKNMSISTLKEFKRKIKTSYDEGNKDSYFLI
jgi:hypothetical protein